jgi:hypothetical protein
MASVDAPIDIEDEVRQAIGAFIDKDVLVPPLPAVLPLPCIEVEASGGTIHNHIEKCEISLTSRANEEATAMELMLSAIGFLNTACRLQTTNLRAAIVSALPSWVEDTARPDLATCVARLTVIAHAKTKELDNA